MKKIVVSKDFFKDLKFKITMPTITCSCGEEILDTPTNRLNCKHMKKYRVTKEHPYLRDDLVLEERTSGNYQFQVADKRYISLGEIEENPTWFEEIDSRWKPLNMQSAFVIREYGVVEQVIWDWDVMLARYWTFGNCFKTREEAEQARDKVKELLLSLNTQS